MANSPAAWNERALGIEDAAAATLQSERGQTRRMARALAHLELRRGDSLLDFGCGTGRLAGFLPDGVEYHAHDFAVEMLWRTGLRVPVAVLHERLPVGGAWDHVVAIGPFNLEEGWSREDTWETVGALWARCRRSLVVSLLRGEPGLGHITYRADEASAFAQISMCTRFLVDASYLDNDLMLVMRR